MGTATARDKAEDRRSSPFSFKISDFGRKHIFRYAIDAAENMSFLPKSEILKLKGLDRLSSALSRAVYPKVRLIGGEPLVRRSIMMRSGELDN